eukprot:GHVH01006556.1.p1 GENE.GHVH01006556.1~~GHVH01006556.1.p1  ORF type:complete len:835 (+),score=141.75 GHVH01006556.1:742-3246(+)
MSDLIQCQPPEGSQMHDPLRCQCGPPWAEPPECPAPPDPEESEDASSHENLDKEEEEMAEYSYALNLMKHAQESRVHGIEEKFEEMVFQAPIDMQNRDIADHNDAADGVIWMAQSYDVDYISRMHLLSNEITFEKAGWLNKAFRPVGCKKTNTEELQKMKGRNVLKVVQMDGEEMFSPTALSPDPSTLQATRCQSEVFPEFESIRLLSKAIIFPDIWDRIMTQGIPICLYHIAENEINKDPTLKRINSNLDAKATDDLIEQYRSKVAGMNALLTVCPTTTHLILVDNAPIAVARSIAFETNNQSRNRLFTGRGSIKYKDDFSFYTGGGNEEENGEENSAFVPTNSRTHRRTRGSVVSAMSTHRNSGEIFTPATPKEGVSARRAWNWSNRWHKYAKHGTDYSRQKATARPRQTIITMLQDCINRRCGVTAHTKYHENGYPRNLLEAGKLHDVKVWRFPIERLKSFNLKQDAIIRWVKWLRTVQKLMVSCQDADPSRAPSRGAAHLPDVPSPEDSRYHRQHRTAQSLGEYSIKVPRLDLDALILDKRPRLRRMTSNGYQRMWKQAEEGDIMGILESFKGGSWPRLPYPDGETRGKRTQFFIDRCCLLELVDTGQIVGSTAIPETTDLHNRSPEVLIFSGEFDIRIFVELLCIVQTQNPTGSMGCASRPTIVEEPRAVQKPLPMNAIPHSSLSGRDSAGEGIAKHASRRMLGRRSESANTKGPGAAKPASGFRRYKSTVSTKIAGHSHSETEVSMPKEDELPSRLKSNAIQKVKGTIVRVGVKRQGVPEMMSKATMSMDIIEEVDYENESASEGVKRTKGTEQQSSRREESIGRLSS